MTRRARASASATVANLGPGYDVLGLCVEGPRDVVTAELTRDGAVTIVEVRGDDGRLPTAASDNCAGVAAQWVLENYGHGAGVRLWLDKGLPLGSGMGSSAASSVAAALATAALVCPSDFDKRALLDACREGERLATGTPHPDNVAPCLYGGVVACAPRANGHVEVISLPVAGELWVVAVKPNFAVRTADARAALPDAVPMADAVSNLAAIAGLVTALASGDHGLLGRSLGDRLATPYRRRLIAGYDAVEAAALAAGAIGCGISGSGPTMFALSPTQAEANTIAAEMVGAFVASGHQAVSHVSAIDPVGARLEAM